MKFNGGRLGAGEKTEWEVPEMKRETDTHTLPLHWRAQAS